MNLKQFSKTCLTAMLLLWAATSTAQQVVGIQTGTIEAINQEAGYIVINGVSIPYDEGSVSVSYREQPVRTTFLAPGLIISYRVNQNGTIGAINLIGPRNVLEQINQH